MSVKFLFQILKMKNIKGIGSLKRKWNDKIRECLLEQPKQQMNQYQEDSNLKKIYTAMLSDTQRAVDIYKNILVEIIELSMNGIYIILN